MLSADQLVFVALGSNLGDSAATVICAMRELRLLSRDSLQVASLWQTEPVDCPPGSPPFINAVAGLAPFRGETPESLLAKLQVLEKQFGRRPKIALNEPRPLDLDLITFQRETRSSPLLILPHPRAHLRRFVLAPLSEIAPDLVLPGQSETVLHLLSRLPPEPAARQSVSAAEVRNRVGG